MPQGSGPSYPHPSPAPGSSAIGSFAIGVSPIGTISSFDPWQTVISQYANSKALTALITSLNAALDLTPEFDSFFDLQWNVQTAQGYGLDVWGRIVGVTRTISLPGNVTYFGFEEADSWTGFNQAGFFSGGATTTNFELDDADFRTLILAKAAGNICNGGIPAINAILLALFPGRGACYVEDNLNMSLTYVFDFPLTLTQAAIIAQENVLPTPTGVAVTIEQR
jgi:hypothetical protein